MKFPTIICIFLLLLGACKSSKKTTGLDSQKDLFEIKVGQTFEIEFITNASTGYSWEWGNQKEVSVVESGESRYVNMAPKEMMGASSKRYWSFKGVRKGEAILKFEYKRPWENEKPVKTREVKVIVKSK
ncbi:MAG: protease inhibitor I42 family protein [Bacteroidales bacterium]